MEGCWTTAGARSRRTREGWSPCKVFRVSLASMAFFTTAYLRSHLSHLSESGLVKTGFPQR